MIRALFSTLFVALYLVAAQTVSAQSIPSFPSCPNPGGELIASYDSGIHGVPGDATEFTGSDQVFKLNDTQVVQCLCPDSGSGVQTLWWKDSGLSEDEISVITKQGWIRIPNGSLWGLDDAQYFAKNSNFNCKDNGDDHHDDDDDDDDHGHSNGKSTHKSSSSSSSSTSTGGQVLGASTLAATGSWGSIVAAFAVAFLAFSMARKLSKNNR